SQEELYKVSRFLNSNLKGYEASDIQAKGLDSLLEKGFDLGDLTEVAVVVAQSLIYSPPDQQIYIEGESQLFNSILDGFESKKEAGRVIECLEDRQFICELMNHTGKGSEVAAQIGIQIDGQKVSGLSILTKDYF